MQTFLTECVRWVNLPYTIVVGALGVYWITVIAGLFDIDIFDFDIDTEADLDVDGGFESLLNFLNVGVIPFSVWISLLLFQMWAYSICFNLVVDAIYPPLPLFGRFLLVILIFLPLASFFTKLITAPLKSLFEEEKVMSKPEFVGKECVVTSSTIEANFGTAEISIGGRPQLIDVRIKPDESFTLKKGETALIYSYDAERDVFYVTNA